MLAININYQTILLIEDHYIFILFISTSSTISTKKYPQNYVMNSEVKFRTWADHIR